MSGITNILASLIFALGAIGFIARRNAIVMILCAELMLLGVLLNLADASRRHADYGGQVLAIMVITVAACEAAFALVFVLTLYQRKGTLDISQWSLLGEEVVSEEYKNVELATQHEPLRRDAETKTTS